MQKKLSAIAKMHEENLNKRSKKLTPSVPSEAEEERKEQAEDGSVEDEAKESPQEQAMEDEKGIEKHPAAAKKAQEMKKKK